MGKFPIRIPEPEPEALFYYCLSLFSSFALASRSSLLPSCSGMLCGTAGPGWAWVAENLSAETCFAPWGWDASASGTGWALNSLSTLPVYVFAFIPSQLAHSWYAQYKVLV